MIEQWDKRRVKRKVRKHGRVEQREHKVLVKIFLVSVIDTFN